MNPELLNSKIELLQEQIDNLEKSGFFTEAEMDKCTVSLNAELNSYKYIEKLFSLSNEHNGIADSLKKAASELYFGKITPEQIEESQKKLFGIYSHGKPLESIRLNNHEIISEKHS